MGSVTTCPLEHMFKNIIGRLRLYSSLPPASSSVASVPARWSTSPTIHRVRWPSVSGHLNPQLAPVEQRAIHGVHCVFSVALVEETHEGETAALFGVPVPGNVHVPHPTILLKNSSESLGRSSVSQVVHFEGGHPFDVWRRPTVTHFFLVVSKQRSEAAKTETLRPL